MFDKIAEVSLLYDFYAQLLTAKQREALRLYHEENYSLAEIAKEFSISRQAVYDALKNAEKALYEYEQKLGLVKKFAETGSAIKEIDSAIDAIVHNNGNNRELIKQLRDIKQIIDALDQ